MDAISIREREKYERMWTRDEYRDDHVTAHARTALAHFGARPGDSVIDFGAGAGYASAAFQEAGLHVLAIDIALNAMAPSIAAVVPRLLASLWELPVGLSADWGFCCDVLEHVPTDRVDDVLRALRASARRSTYLCISLRPDGCGQLIGDTLHLTVRPLDWWTARLRRYWPAIDVLVHEPGERAVVVVGTESRRALPGPPARPLTPVAAAYAARMTQLAVRLQRLDVGPVVIFGCSDAAHALAEAAEAAGLEVPAFVRSGAVAPGETLFERPVLPVAGAAARGWHVYAIGSFGSAPAMLTTLEAVYAGRAETFQAYLPDGPAPRG